MFWNHQDVSFWVVCFACYKPADPLQRIVDTVREGGRDFTGGQGGRWTALLQTLQYHAIHAGIMPRGGRYEAGHRLGSDRQQDCRLPFASAVSSVLILTDAELDGGRSTVLHLTSKLPHSALLSVNFWAKWTDDAILLSFKRCTTGVSSDFSIPCCVVLYPERWWYASLYWVK